MPRVLCMLLLFIAEFSCHQGLTLKRHIEATLGSGNIRDAVRLPVGEDLYEWLAVNTVDFYNAISVLFGMLEEVCTVHVCSLMTAGPKVVIDLTLFRCCFGTTIVYLQCIDGAGFLLRSMSTSGRTPNTVSL